MSITEGLKDGDGLLEIGNTLIQVAMQPRGESQQIERFGEATLMLQALEDRERLVMVVERLHGLGDIQMPVAQPVEAVGDHDRCPTVAGNGEGELGVAASLLIIPGRPELAQIEQCLPLAATVT